MHSVLAEATELARNYLQQPLTGTSPSLLSFVLVSHYSVARLDQGGTRSPRLSQSQHRSHRSFPPYEDLFFKRILTFSQVSLAPTPPSRSGSTTPSMFPPAFPPLLPPLLALPMPPLLAALPLLSPLLPATVLPPIQSAPPFRPRLIRYPHSASPPPLTACIPSSPRGSSRNAVRYYLSNIFLYPPLSCFTFPRSVLPTLPTFPTTWSSALPATRRSSATPFATTRSFRFSFSSQLTSLQKDLQLSSSESAIQSEQPPSHRQLTRIISRARYQVLLLSLPLLDLSLLHPLLDHGRLPLRRCRPRSPPALSLTLPPRPLWSVASPHLRPPVQQVSRHQPAHRPRSPPPPLPSFLSSPLLISSIPLPLFDPVSCYLFSPSSLISSSSSSSPLATSFSLL